MKSQIVFHGKRNDPEANGEIFLRETAYGYALFVGGASLDENGHERAVAVIDLFPQSKAGKQIPHNTGVLGHIYVYGRDEEEPVADAVLYKYDTFMVVD